jgi:ribosomal protein S6--L-glutamate ligase
MRLVSFDAFRGMGLAHDFVKPENWLNELALLRAADVLLYPASWQVNALHHVLNKRIFPGVASYRLGWDKIEMTRAFQLAVPEAVPETLILPANENAVEQAIDRLGLPLVVKQPRNSMGRGVSLMNSRAEMLEWIRHNDVLYAQQYLPNDGDVRVVWIGRGVAAAYWRRNGEGFLNNVAQGGVIDFDRVPLAALELVQRTALALGVDHAGFDVMLVDGYPFLLEFNVLFGNDGLNRLGIDPRPLILDYLEASCEKGSGLPFSTEDRPAAPILQ